MAVGSVDSSSSTGNSQSTKDAYDQRERELIAKHRQEMADLQRKHQKAVEELRSQYDQALGNLRDNMRDTMSEREKAHLKEVQDIQKLNKQRYVQKSTDDDDRYQNTRDTLTGELNRSHDKDQADQARLTREFQDDMNQRDQKDADLESHYREGSQAALDDQRRRLEEKSEGDKNDLRGQISAGQKQKERETTALRRDKDQTVNQLNARMDYQRSSLEGKFHDALTRERKQYDTNVKDLNSNFKQSITENREKFENKAQELADQYSTNFENLKGSVNGRINDQVNASKQEITSLRDQNFNDRLQGKHQRDLETRNQRYEFGRNFEELENRRQNAMQAAHKEKTRYLDEQQRRNNKYTQQQTAFYTDKLNQQKLTDNNNFDQRIGAAERDRDMTKIRAGQVNKKIFDEYSGKTVEQNEFYEDQAQNRTVDYNKRLGEQRNTLDKQRYDDINNLQNQLAKESIAHQEKLVDTIGNYEKQMSGMRNDYEKRLKRQSELFREQTEKQVKGMQADREASEAKLQARLSSLKDTYERELDQLRKRQANERQELADKKATT